VLGDNGKHDDQVDSTAQFLDWFKKPFPGQNVFELTAERPKKGNRQRSLCPHQGATRDRRDPYLLRPARHDQQGPPRQDVRRGCQLLDPLRPDLNHRICLMDRTDVAIRISRMLATSQSGLLRTLTGCRTRVPIEQSFGRRAALRRLTELITPSAAFPPTLISVANASSARNVQPRRSRCRSTAAKVIRSGIIAPGEAEQFPLRAGEPTLRGDAAEPMRQLAVMLASVSRPPVPCGNVLGHGCVFI